MKWDVENYNEKHNFVYKYGADIVKLLEPKTGELILDLGCGTGELTEMIRLEKTQVIGVDNSEEMIIKAKKSFPKIDFRLMDGRNLSLTETFDAIFSNAVLHWIHEQDNVMENVFKHLKPKGRFVFEMGGKGNVENILTALQSQMQLRGYKDKYENYFPSLAQQSQLLERHGFIVRYAAYFDRETELSDTENGIIDWIKMFRRNLLEGIEPKDREEILLKVKETVKPTNYRNGKWYADYKRIRIVAVRP